MSQLLPFSLTKQPSFGQRVFLKVMGSSIPTGGIIAPGVTRFAESYSTSYAIAIGNGKFVLIDAGIDKEAKEIIGYLASQGASAADVVAVFLTHAHFDHFAGVGQFPGAYVYVGLEDKGVLEGTQEYDGMLPRLAGKLKEPAVANAELLQTVADGQTITVGNKVIGVFAVPGHTRGSVVYLVDDLLFVGDAMTFSTKKALKPPVPVSFDSKLGVTSLRKLVQRFENEGIVPRLILPTHSGEGTFDGMRKLVA